MTTGETRHDHRGLHRAGHGRAVDREPDQAGFDVVGHNRSRPPVDRLANQGGPAADSVAEAVGGADVVVTMLSDSANVEPDVEDVALGDDEVITNARADALYIDMSTMRPATATRGAEAARGAGVRPLDGPVSDGEQGAIDGELSIMLGGEAEDFERARPVLDAVGWPSVHVGPSGSGQTVKAADQLIVAGTSQLVAEGIVSLEAHGVDTDAAVLKLAGVGRQPEPRTEGGRDAAPRLHARVPRRPAPQTWASAQRCTQRRGDDPLRCPGAELEIDNPNEVFHADDHPYGLIESSVRRDHAPEPGPAFDSGQGWKSSPTTGTT